MALRLPNILLSCLLVAASAQVVVASQRATSRAVVYRQVNMLAELGVGCSLIRTLRLGGLSCASCHDPAQAYGRPVRVGRARRQDMQQMGLRAENSLRYLQATPLHRTLLRLRRRGRCEHR
jgi:cytochrome c peroxidase